MEKIQTALLGGTGIGTSLVATIPDFSDITSIIVQIIIGIGTLIGLFRKKKNK